MEYAALFILVFGGAFVLHCITRKWGVAVAVPVILYLCWLVYRWVEAVEPQWTLSWTFALIFELPIIFMSSLLASYVYEIYISDE